MAMDVEAEIRDLKRRVGELEGSFGFMTDQIRSVHRDLLGFQTETEHRFDQVDERFDKIDGRFDTVEGRLDRIEDRLGTSDGRMARLEGGIQALREELPGVVGDAMRVVLRERDRKP